VPRVRNLPLPLRAGALLAIILLAMPNALAQIVDTADSLFMRPLSEEDLRNPSRLQRPRTPQQKNDQRQIGTLPNYRYQPGTGAGTTGFDSINARAKAKAGQKANAKAGSKAAPKAAYGTPPRPPVAAAPPPPSPNSAAALLPQYRDRRGSPNSSQTSVPTAATVPVTAGTIAPLRRRVLVEDDPFAPIGVRVGAFNVRPAIEFTGGYDTNPARTSGGKPSWFGVIAPELLVNSNWTRHELTATLRGSYSAYTPASELNRPSMDARVNGRVDVTDSTRLDFEGRFLLGTDRPGSPNIQANLERFPIFTNLGGTAGIGQRFNRFEVTAKALADRTVYQNSTFVDGSTESNDDRNFNRLGGAVRAAYELTPGVKPFIETAADSRVHDLAIDRFGLRRDSEGGYVKGGSTFEISRILTGDAAVGWVTRSYKDPSLRDINGFTFDASLVWLMSGLTTVKLAAATTADETTIPGVSGVFARDVTLQIDHAFRRWLIATLRFNVGFDEYVGSPRNDDRFALSAGIVYKLTREMAVRAEVRREWRNSNVAGNDFVSNVVLVGLRLQR
jgi:hypothetical protein